MTANDNIRGALLMIAAMAGFTFNDVVFKTVAGEVPLFQAIFIRGCIVSIGFLAVLLFTNGLRPKIAKRDRKLIALRTVGEIGATVFFLVSLFNAPIADVTAILQAAPLVITLAGAVIYKEPVGWRRYGAIAIGMVGVLLIVRPGGGGFNPYVLFAIGALAFILLRDLPTRRLTSTVPSMFVALITAVSITAASGIASLATDWVPLTVSVASRLGLAAFFIFGAYIFAVMVMRTGDMGFVQPFRFTAIIWAILLGVLVFEEYPDALSLLGTAIVVSMGVYTFYRERQTRR